MADFLTVTLTINQLKANQHNLTNTIPRLSYHNCVVLHEYANNEYMKGNKVLPDSTYDLVVRQLNTQRSHNIIGLNKSTTLDLSDYRLSELQDLINFCDAEYKVGRPQLPNHAYDALVRAKKNRKPNQEQELIERLKQSAFACGHWKRNDILDLIHMLDKSWMSGTTHLENKLYDILMKEAYFRLDHPLSVAFPGSKFPAHWDMPASDFDMIELIKGFSDEYKYLEKNFKLSLPNANIISIKRIQNYGLFRMFSITKHIMLQHQPKPATGFPEVETRYLYHGNNNVAGCNEIMRYGFYRQYCPGGAIGDGCYYALNASYSNQNPYVLQYPDGSKQLFIAQVLVGKAGQGQNGMKQIPLGLDSVYDGPGPKPANMYCIFNHYQAYPEYVIHYTGA